MEATTLGDIVNQVQASCTRLSRLGIFKEIQVTLDTPKQPHSGADRVNVILEVKERPRLFLKTGTEIGMDEGSVSLSGNIRNVFGAGEALEGSVTRGTRTNAAFRLTFTKPLFANPDNVLELSGFQQEVDWTETSSLVEGERGASVQWKVGSGIGHHCLGLSYGLREIGKLLENASLSVSRLNKMTTKAAISHTFIRDFRNDQMLPTRGSMLKWTSEYAGFNLGVPFVKNEVESQFCLRMPFGFALSTSLRGGLLYSLDGQPSAFHDRFFLGGPWSVRGFKTHGIGPRAPAIQDLKADALGGDAYWSSGISLLAPVPFLRRFDFFKAHFFLNAGSLIPVDSSKPVQELPNQVTTRFTNSSIAASVGAGVLLRTSLCRVEVNAVKPLSMGEVDVLSPRIQIGLGLQFL
jgi:outer membrane protein insertion porin family